MKINRINSCYYEIYIDEYTIEFFLNTMEIYINGCQLNFKQFDAINTLIQRLNSVYGSLEDAKQAMDMEVETFNLLHNNVVDKVQTNSLYGEVKQCQDD